MFGMSDVVTVAVITGLGTIVVAVGGIIGQVWGPAWREARERSATEEAAAKALRYERGLDFVKAVRAAAEYPSETRIWDVSIARAQFLSTLRPGEQGAEFFTQRMAGVVLRSSPTHQTQTELLDQYVDLLFRWLRGEVDINNLETPPANWGAATMVSEEPGKAS